MRKLLHNVAPALLVLLFTYAAASKLINPVSARHEMHNQHFPPEVADVLWLGVPLFELVAAAMMLLNEKWQERGLLLSSILMTVFTGYIALVLLGFWDRVPCSCGGVLKNMSWKTHFIFNLFFLAISTTAWYQRYKGKAENLRKE
ncbi:hypothetical protein FPZ42_07010 [Mucilaginibacter achroorhodeus]|uniref:Methylamine utilisation protein MauE domain-containing protein n=1 Tax=Mucilaginibacter achroorhodeus TaxID=2599294 RepID=A0A563U604_9SPHI|nr:MauE/DoxX family redox-associated membrane protein [Mucilaginibacter achroorhodeus]TWR26780.1 hypothetical protein FPZ42_07010 [Mucilaginibacter achroorhodeus]